MNQGQLEGRLATVESRVASLETLATVTNPKLDRVDDKLVALTERLAKLEERVNHLPSKEFMVTVALGLISALALVGGFLGKIQQFFGGVPKP